MTADSFTDTTQSNIWQRLFSASSKKSFTQHAGMKLDTALQLRKIQSSLRDSWAAAYDGKAPELISIPSFQASTQVSTSAEESHNFTSNTALDDLYPSKNQNTMTFSDLGLAQISAPALSSFRPFGAKSVMPPWTKNEWMDRPETSTTKHQPKQLLNRLVEAGNKTMLTSPEFLQTVGARSKQKVAHLSFSQGSRATHVSRQLENSMITALKATSEKSATSLAR